MSFQTRVAAKAFDEKTLPEPEPSVRNNAGPGQARHVCVADFKSRDTKVSVKHGPTDPSRIWIAIESPTAALHVSVEEEVGRNIAEGLSRALSTFRAVRSRLRLNRDYP